MTDKLVAALVALAQRNIPPDIQELLVSGNPMRDVAPNALAAVITAVYDEALEEAAKVVEVRFKGWNSAQPTAAAIRAMKESNL